MLQIIDFSWVEVSPNICLDQQITSEVLHPPRRNRVAVWDMAQVLLTLVLLDLLQETQTIYCKKNKQ